MFTKSIGLTEPTPNNTVTDTEPKLGIGLGSQNKPVLTSEELEKEEREELEKEL